MKLGMNRASLVYAVVCTVFAFGIWAILEVGTAFLTAPRDVDGRWAPADEPEGAGFSISQSGQFVRFSLENGGGHFDAVLTQSTQTTQGKTDQLLKFDGGGWHVTGMGSPASDTVRFAFEAPAGKQGPRTGTYRPAPMNIDPPPPAANSKPGAHS